MLVDRLEGGRVLEGDLGCPICEARFPIHGGAACLATPASPAGAGDEDRDPDLAVTLAALLGTAETRGVFLLGPGLSASAGAVSRLAPGSEILAVETSSGGGTGHEGAVTPLVLGGLDPLPILDGRLRGVALSGRETPPWPETARVLVPGGRLVVMDPTDGLDARLAGTGLTVVASDDRALVAERRP